MYPGQVESGKCLYTARQPPIDRVFAKRSSNSEKSAVASARQSYATVPRGLQGLGVSGRSIGEGCVGGGGSAVQRAQGRMNINVLKQLNTRSKRALRRPLSVNPLPAICIHVVEASFALSGTRLHRRWGVAVRDGKFVTGLPRPGVEWSIRIYGFVKSGEEGFSSKLLWSFIVFLSFLTGISMVDRVQSLWILNTVFLHDSVCNNYTCTVLRTLVYFMNKICLILIHNMVFYFAYNWT